MGIALIVSTYNWTEALELCLMSICNLSEKPSEVIIADDGSDERTKHLIDYYRQYLPSLLHVWHEDRGFRLAEIRNKAIFVSTSAYIIQIDGDVILHRDFIKDHRVFAKEGTFVKGRRVMIGPKKTRYLLRKRSIAVSAFSKDLERREHGIRIPSYHLFFPAKGEQSSDSIMGSNMAFWHQDFVRVNGYNNSLQGWGAEDKELAQRFVNAGLSKRKVQFSAIQFHLHHRESERFNHDAQIAVIEQLRQNCDIKCADGLREINQDFQVYE